MPLDPQTTRASEFNVVRQLNEMRDDLKYAGFWPRFAAFWIDVLIMSPLLMLAWWGKQHFRLFDLYFFIPGTVFGFFYSVYLVKRYGGTPGKRLMRVRIVKENGAPITYRESLMRYIPEWLLSTGTSGALMIASLHLTDAQYFAASSLVERVQLTESVAPSWYKPFELVSNIWVWSEFIVMLTNKRRRALHDFIANTVVIRDEKISEMNKQQL